MTRWQIMWQMIGNGSSGIGKLGQRKGMAVFFLSSALGVFFFLSTVFHGFVFGEDNPPSPELDEKMQSFSEEASVSRASEELEPSLRPVDPLASFLPSDPFVYQLRTISWAWFPQSSERIHVNQVLATLLKRSPDIQISREKVRETFYRLKSVKRKRVLFFFKYLDASYLEGSAESDVEAATAHRRWVEQQALLKGLESYDALVRSVIQRRMAYLGMGQRLRELDAKERRFASGDETSLDVIAAKVALMDQYQAYEEANAHYEKASQLLAQQMGILGDVSEPLAQVEQGHSGQIGSKKAVTSEKPVRKHGVSEGVEMEENSLVIKWFQPTELQTSPLTFPAWKYLRQEGALTAEEVSSLALQKRWDLKELQLRKLSFDQLEKAAAIKFNKAQQRMVNATVTQLGYQLQKLQGAIRAQSPVLLHDLHRARATEERFRQRLDLAELAYRQTRISEKAGFQSLDDVEKAKFKREQAQAQWVLKRMDRNLAAVRLLAHMGRLSPSRVMGDGEAGSKPPSSP